MKENLNKKVLSDEELMEITGGASFAESSEEIVAVPMYGVPTDPIKNRPIKLYYGVTLMKYGVPRLKYGVVTAVYSISVDSLDSK